MRSGLPGPPGQGRVSPPISSSVRAVPCLQAKAEGGLIHPRRHKRMSAVCSASLSQTTFAHSFSQNADKVCIWPQHHL